MESKKFDTEKYSSPEEQKQIKTFVYIVYLVILAVVLIAQSRDLGPFVPWFYKSAPIFFVSLISGFVLGVFLSKKLAGFRILAIITFLFLGSLAISFNFPPIGGLITFLIAMQLGLILFDLESIKKYRKPTEFGSAEWADYDHLIKNNLIGKEGLFLGFFGHENKAHPLQYKSNRHLLTVAPTRSGKGVSAIIPNLLTYEGSAVIIDPKGENAMITAYRRGQGNEQLRINGLGQNVHIVDPWQISGLPSSCFNPLDWLKADDPDINENAMILAESIIAPRAGAQDQFWDDEAKALLMGILLYVALDETEQANRTLGRVRDIISAGEIEFSSILENMMENENVIVRSAATRTLSKEERLKSSVLASLQSHTHFLDSPRMRENLSRSDFGFEDLKKTPTTIYLVLPADRLDTFGRWLRLLIQQALTINARNIEENPQKPILFMLDEMAALGRLSMVEKAYSLMAGFGVQLWGIIQDVGQLERIYGKGWQTFVGNSGAIQYFGSRDHQTADYFSKLCGVTTIEKFSFTSSVARAFSSTMGGGQNGGSSTSSTTNTYGTTKDLAQRQLAYPDELMVMKEDSEIVFIENFNPISGHKMPWFQDHQLKQLGVNLYAKQPAIETGKQVIAPQPEPIKEEPEPLPEPENKLDPDETISTVDELDPDATIVVKEEDKE